MFGGTHAIRVNNFFFNPRCPQIMRAWNLQIKFCAVYTGILGLFKPRLFIKVRYFGYGKCLLQLISRESLPPPSHQQRCHFSFRSYVIWGFGVSIPIKTTFSVHRSASRMSNLFKQPLIVTNRIDPPSTRLKYFKTCLEFTEVQFTIRTWQGDDKWGLYNVWIGRRQQGNLKQGYPQRTRLQRRLYGICLVCFLAFRFPGQSWLIFVLYH